jgi:hypothetical protein
MQLCIANVPFQQLLWTISALLFISHPTHNSIVVASSGPDIHHALDYE